MKNFEKLNKNEMKMIVGGDDRIDSGADSCAKSTTGGNQCGGACRTGGSDGTCSDSTEWGGCMCVA